MNDTEHIYIYIYTYDAIYMMMELLFFWAGSEHGGSLLHLGGRGGGGTPTWEHTRSPFFLGKEAYSEIP